MRLDSEAAASVERAISLSAADGERAERFKRGEDRRRFVLGRGILALLLRQAGLIPSGPIEFAFTEQKKPYLPQLPGEHFSITHAGDLVAVALAHGARVGLDVESLDRAVDLGPLAERIFSPGDFARFQAVPEADQRRAFFRAWTGKEAVLKAQGVGLFGGLQEIAAPLHDEAATIACPENSGSWRLHPLQFPAGYVGCVACDNLRAIEQHEIGLPHLLA